MGSDNEERGEIIIWLDSDEVLSQTRMKSRYNKLKDALVLYIYLWNEIESLQTLIESTLKWEKVASYIATRTYKPEVKIKGDTYSIHLNEYMNELACYIMEESKQHLDIYSRQELFIPTARW